MKWAEHTLARKILAVTGYLCVAAYLLLTVLEVCNIQLVPKAATCALMGVSFLSQGLAQAGKKKIWGYSLAAGWFLVAVMYCF